MDVIEILSNNCAVLHIKFKRIWPSTSRDWVVCSEIIKINDNEWTVQNISVDHPKAITDSVNYVRMNTNVKIIVKQKPVNKKIPISKTNMLTTLTYISYIDIGYWSGNSIIQSACSTKLFKVLEKLKNYTIKSSLTPSSSGASFFATSS